MKKVLKRLFGVVMFIPRLLMRMGVRVLMRVVMSVVMIMAVGWLMSNFVFGDGLVNLAERFPEIGLLQEAAAATEGMRGGRSGEGGGLFGGGGLPSGLSYEFDLENRSLSGQIENDGAPLEFDIDGDDGTATLAQDQEDGSRAEEHFNLRFDPDALMGSVIVEPTR